MRMRILVVDDEKILAKAIAEKCGRENFDTAVAYDGNEALAEMRRERPDLVILDLVMPKKSGIDALAEMKKDEDLKDIPVIVVSNLGSDEDIKKALKLGATDYFVKSQHPINEIIDHIKEILFRSA